MKKLMFTAIALIAFSSASMANKIAEEKTKSENDDSKEILIKKKDCIQEMIDMYEFLINYENDGQDDVFLLNSLTSLCETGFGGVCSGCAGSGKSIQNKK